MDSTIGVATARNAASAERKPKVGRFNIRVSSDEKCLVEHAARLSRMTSSQFILQAALRSAEEVTADHTRFLLSEDEWHEFTSMLDRSARELPALAEAAAKPRLFRER
jgi:uncharacterized protein (DUF1778 family)